MKLLTIFLFLNMSLWAQNKFEEKKVYFNHEGRLQYGSIRVQTNPPQPTSANVPVSYERYIGTLESNRTQGVARDVPYSSLAFETEKMNLQIDNKQRVLKKDEVVMGQDGKFYLVQGVFGNNGKVALLELSINPNNKRYKPFYFNRKNNVNIHDGSFIKAVSVSRFAEYEAGKDYDRIGSQTYCEYLDLQATLSGKPHTRNCKNPKRTSRINYIFSDGTLFVNEITVLSLPKLLERYSPPLEEGRSVQGQ